MKTYLTIVALICLLVTNYTLYGQEVNVDSLLQIVENKKLKDEERLKACIKVYDSYALNDINEAKKMANIILDFSQSINNEEYEIKAYNMLGVIYMRASKDMDSAHIYLDKAIDIITPNDKYHLSSKIHNSKGAVYMYQEQYDNALNMFLIALEEAEQYNEEDVSMLLNNIAVIWKRKKEYRKSIQYLKRALEIIEATDGLNKGATLNNLGTNYNKLEQLDSALYYMKRAANVALEENNQYSLLKTYTNMANVYGKQEKYDLGVEYAEKAVQKARDLNFPIGIAKTLNALAYLEFQKDNYAKAIKYAKESLAIDAITANEVALEVLYQAYAESGNYKMAYDYLLKDKALEDSLFTQESEAKIRELEIQYDVKQKEQENELLKLEQLTDQKTIQNRNFLLIILMLVLLLGGGWSLSVYRSNQLKKQYNEELENRNQYLQDMDELKTQFFSNISHEFKTPLTLIISPLKQLLRQNNITNEQRFLVKTAEQNSTQLLELIKQFLELMKLDVKETQVQNSAVDFTKMLKMLSSNFEPMSKNNNVRFNLHFDRNMPLLIQTDAYKLKTIIKNLLSNAIKYTGENGQIDLTITEQDEQLKIEVKDNGQGIHSYDIPHIFNRFYQVNPNDNQGGTGIGLAICKEYANLLGGSISVKSEWEKGSIFTVIIPKIEVNTAIEISDKSVLSNALATSSIPTKTESNIKILIIEDNLDMQNYIRFTLNPFYETVGTPNGKKALELLKQQDFDLIITDLMMPEMDGMEFINTLKATPKFSNIPLIMLSAVSDHTKKINALRIGIDDYMTKPFEAEELLIRIEHLLEYYQERTAVQVTATATTNTENKEAEVSTETTTLSKEDEIWLGSLEAACMKNLDRTDFTMSNLAHEMAMSYSKLWRLTNKMLGMTPTQYLQEIRFREALQILNRREANSIKQLAYQVGFKDEKHFSRNFKKRFGKYPSAYLE